MACCNTKILPLAESAVILIATLIRLTIEPFVTPFQNTMKRLVWGTKKTLPASTLPISCFYY